MQQLLGLQQFAHQPHQWDPPGTSHLEVSISSDAILRFARFCVWPRARQLLVDGQPIELGSRAFDLLMVLIGAPGILITKKEIMRRVWPDTVVDESNLKVQMSGLRRVLNVDRDVIKTVHGRGYVFTSEVTGASIVSDALERPGRGSPRRQLATGSRMVVPDDRTQPVVVVIDDDQDIRDAFRGLLRAVGLSVESFASVQEFL